MRIVFIDSVCPSPYTPNTITESALGGSESTCLRVAESLATRGHCVTVFQHNLERLWSFNADYMPLSMCNTVEEPDVVISQRSAYGVAIAGQFWPKARNFIWMHDMLGDLDGNTNPNNYGMFLLANELKTPFICVSQWHKNHTANVILKSGLKLKDIKLHYIYNPVVVPEFKDIKIKNDQLVYFSSPHKGLHETLENFQELRKLRPEMKMIIANPGYLVKDMREDLMQGVTNLGRLPQPEALKHVAESFAVYSANFIFPETFGLVHAEANAVGTPCLVHPYGANQEVLGFGSEQILNARDAEKFNERLIQWLDQGRPVVKADDRFKLEVVTDAWEGLLQ